LMTRVEQTQLDELLKLNLWGLTQKSLIMGGSNSCFIL
jgi:hypothetical protein